MRQSRKSDAAHETDAPQSCVSLTFYRMMGPNLWQPTNRVSFLRDVNSVLLHLIDSSREIVRYRSTSGCELEERWDPLNLIVAWVSAARNLDDNRSGREHARNQSRDSITA